MRVVRLVSGMGMNEWENEGQNGEMSGTSETLNGMEKSMYKQLLKYSFKMFISKLLFMARDF